MLRLRMDLREFLDSYLEDHPELTDLEIGKRLGYASNSPVSMVRRNERTIPEDRIQDWADALGLMGESREQFVELAHLDLSTSHLREQYFRLKGRIDQLEKDKRGFIEEIQELRIKLSEMRRQRKDTN